jgi:hypothetical protein
VPAPRTLHARRDCPAVSSRPSLPVFLSTESIVGCQASMSAGRKRGLPDVPLGTLIAAGRAAIRLHPEAVVADMAVFDAALWADERSGGPAEHAPHRAEPIEA